MCSLVPRHSIASKIYCMNSVSLLGTPAGAHPILWMVGAKLNNVLTNRTTNSHWHCCVTPRYVTISRI